jgi:hypothetical protein
VFIIHHFLSLFSSSVLTRLIMQRLSICFIIESFRSVRDQTAGYCVVKNRISVGEYQHLGGAYCPHLQSRRFSSV